MTITIKIEGKRAIASGAPVIVCGNADYKVNFLFDEEWDTAGVKTARFVYVQDGEIKCQDVVFSNSEAKVPVLSNTKEVMIGVFAGDLQTTTPARVPCERSIRCGTGAPPDPTPEQYDQIMAILRGGVPEVDIVTAVNTYMTDHQEELGLSQSKTQLIKLSDLDTTINGLHIVIKNNHVQLKSLEGGTTGTIYNYIKTDEGLTQFEAGVPYVASVQNVVSRLSNSPVFSIFLWKNTSNSTQQTITVYPGSSVKVKTDNIESLMLAWNISTLGEFDIEFDLQIEPGETVTTFEPFYVVERVGKDTITLDKLSPDVREELTQLSNEVPQLSAEIPQKANKTELTHKLSSFQSVDVLVDGVVQGYYYGIDENNSTSGWECVPDLIECKAGDVFRFSAATYNQDGHQQTIKIYDANRVLIGEHFGAETLKTIATFTDKLFIVPEGVAFIAFNCWKHPDNLYSLSVEKLIPCTDEHNVLINSLVASSPALELIGKSIYSDGDSIAQGTGTGGRSYAYILADKYNMKLTSGAVGNTTLAVRAGRSDSIYERMTNLTGEYDYILFDGGTNDITQLADGKIELGVVADGVTDDLDPTTLLGALEGICRYLNTNHFKAKKLFIFVTNRVDMLKLTKETYTEMKKVLNKYGVQYIDLSNVNNLGHWDSSVASDYYAKIKDDEGNEKIDTLHPNLEGHKVFYLPYLEKALLYGGYVNS